MMSREKSITVKCTDSEYQRISQGASKSHAPVSSYLRELGTEGRYTKKAKKEIRIVAIVKLTQQCNDMRKNMAGADSVIDQIQEGVSELWRIL